MATFLRSFNLLRISTSDTARSATRTACQLQRCSQNGPHRQYQTLLTSQYNIYNQLCSTFNTQNTLHNTIGSIRYVSGHLGYKNKSHSGTSKRIKLTGNGLLKRYPSGKQHSAQSKNAKRVHRLRTSVIINSAQHMSVMRGIPAGQTHMMKRKRMKYIAKLQQKHQIPVQLPPRPIVRDKLLDLQ